MKVIIPLDAALPSGHYAAMWNVEILILIFATFVLAGMVKGVIGLGLPSVSLAILTATIGLKAAMAVLIAPSLVMNIWQASVGGAFREVLRRTWILIVAASLGTWFGGNILAASDGALLSALLGVLLVLYSATSLATPQFTVLPKWEPWLSPPVGFISGIFTGMTGSFVVPGILYMQAMGLPRDLLVQAMGVVFTAATIALAISLGGHGLLTGELAILSSFTLVPAAIGMVLGQKIRSRLSDVRFRQVFFIGLILLGLYIVVRAMEKLEWALF